MTHNWLSRLFTGSNTTTRKRQPHFRLRLEAVEERALLAALSVDIGDAGCNVAGPVYCEIQEAVNAAAPGDKIEVASGTYQPVDISVNGITIKEANGNSNPVIDASGENTGVQLTASDVTIKGLHVQDATLYGFRLDSGGNTLTGNTASGNGYGFALSAGGSGNTLTGNTASGNGFDGFLLFSSSGNTLTGNIASGNGNGFVLVGGSGNTLTGNTASGNGVAGFGLFGGSGNTLTGNTASGNGFDGFVLFATSGNTLTGNTASGNLRDGFRLESSSSNTLTGNTASGNDNGFVLFGGSGNTLTGNTASGNLGDGFRLEFSSGNTLTGNTARKNAGYGFYVDAIGTNIFVDNKCKQNGLGGSNQLGIC